MDRRRSTGRVDLVLLFVLLACFAGCAAVRQGHSDLFYVVFTGERDTFRGISLKDSLVSVKRLENAQHLQYEDLLGMAYAYPLPDLGMLSIEYYTGSPNNVEPHAIQAIVASVRFAENYDGKGLYEEILDHYTTLYGRAEGAYGAYFWPALSPKGLPTEVYLKLDNTRREITINYVAKTNQ